MPKTAAIARLDEYIENEKRRASVYDGCIDGSHELCLGTKTIYYELVELREKLKKEEGCEN